jgi:hypothetical protein
MEMPDSSRRRSTAVTFRRSCSCFRSVALSAKLDTKTHVPRTPLKGLRTQTTVPKTAAVSHTHSARLVLLHIIISVEGLQRILDCDRILGQCCLQLSSCISGQVWQVISLSAATQQRTPSPKNCLQYNAMVATGSVSVRPFLPPNDLNKFPLRG